MVYVVPAYQRLYVWNQEDQWEPLWSDVHEIADEILRHPTASNSPDIASNGVEEHFLGAVVLKISGTTPELASQYRVIDGQQRLTTLQILIAAAITELDSKGLHDQSDRLRHLTTNSPGSRSTNQQSFKISHIRHSRGHHYQRFADVMAASLDAEAPAPDDGPLADCYSFYRDTINGWLEQVSAPPESAAAALVTTLIVKLTLVAIYLDPHEKEHIIFETLNARGEPLTEWDKIRNYLLYKSDQHSDMSQSDFFESYLDEFDDPWWRQDVGRGVQQRPRTDVFADYWLESRLLRSVAVRRVFREFRKHVDEHAQCLGSMMQELRRAARYFRQFEETMSPDASRESRFHRQRLNLSLGAIWPLLLCLQGLDVDRPERDRWFATLENYFVRRRIAGYQARGHDYISMDLLNEATNANLNGTGIADAMEEQLLQYSDSSTIWPDDGEIEWAVLHRHFPNYIVRLLLLAIESSIIPDRAALQSVSSNLQVEHLMPSGWQPDSWPLPDSLEPDEAESKRTQAIWTLGNLTLLNGRLNAAISNAAWSIKRDEIQKSDNLFLNKRLLEQAPDEWMEEQIYRRGEWMYEEIIKIWPRGTSTST